MTNSRTEELLEVLVELQIDTMRLLAIPLAREAESHAQLAVQLSRLGMENRVISQTLGIPVNSVRKAVSRAKKAERG